VPSAPADMRRSLSREDPAWSQRLTQVDVGSRQRRPRVTPDQVITGGSWPSGSTSMNLVWMKARAC